MENREQNPIVAWVRRYPLIVFFVLAFAISWAFALLTQWLAPGIFSAYDLTVMVAGFGPALSALILNLLAPSGPVKHNRPWLPWAVFLAVFVLISLLLAGSLRDALQGPSTAWMVTLWVLRGAFLALVIACIFANRRTVRDWAGQLAHWRVSFVWYLVALLLPPLISLAGMGLAALMGQPVVFPRSEPIGALLPLLISGFFVTGLLAGPLGLEAGWRGYALPRLQLRTNPLVAALIISVLESLWFFPLYQFGYYPGGMAAFFLRGVLNLYMSVLYTWLYNRTGGSLLLVVIMHTAFNNSLGFWLPFTNYMYLFGFIVAAVLIVWDNMWSRKAEALPPVPVA